MYPLELITSIWNFGLVYAIKSVSWVPRTCFSPSFAPLPSKLDICAQIMHGTMCRRCFSSFQHIALLRRPFVWYLYILKLRCDFRKHAWRCIKRLLLYSSFPPICNILFYRDRSIIALLGTAGRWRHGWEMQSEWQHLQRQCQGTSRILMCI